MYSPTLLHSYLSRDSPDCAQLCFVDSMSKSCGSHCLCYQPRASHATSVMTGHHQNILSFRNNNPNCDFSDSIGSSSSVSPFFPPFVIVSFDARLAFSPSDSNKTSRTLKPITCSLTLKQRCGPGRKCNKSS